MSLRDFSKREKEGELRVQVLALPLYYCDPVIIGRHPDIVGEADAEIASASGTYLELQSRKLLVTNAHVVRKYQEERKPEPRTIFQLAEHKLSDFDGRLVDVDDGCDLATIDVSDRELSPRVCEREELRPRQFYRPPSWPPEAVVEGELVAYAGWPGALRKDANNYRDIEHNPYSVAAVAVTLAMQDRFLVKLDRNDLTYAFGDRRPDAKDFDFRGMSGAPVLRKKSLSYELVGIVMEYSPPPADTFVITNAANIKRDGTLWHNTRR